MMKTIGVFTLTGIILMSILSFANFTGLRIAGLAVVIGVIFFFLNQNLDSRQSITGGLDIKSVGRDLKQKGLWFWMVLPVIMNVVSIGFASLFLPEFLSHVISRTEAFLSWNLIFLMIFQLAFFALGEEIAWRAFFQKQLNKVMPIIPALFLSSLLFSFGHLVSGSPSVLIYDFCFIFVNSLLYGIIFYKTDNAWVSALSHFLANLSSIVIFLLFFRF